MLAAEADTSAAVISGGQWWNYIWHLLKLNTSHGTFTSDTRLGPAGSWLHPASIKATSKVWNLGRCVSVRVSTSPFTPLYWLLYANKYEILKYIFNLKMTIISKATDFTMLVHVRSCWAMIKSNLVKFHNSNRVRWLRILLLVTIVGPRYTAAGNRGQLWVDLALLLFSSVTGNWSCSTGFVTHLNLKQTWTLFSFPKYILPYILNFPKHPLHALFV